MDTLFVNYLDTFANYIKSTDSRPFGSWKFSIVDIEHGSTSIREIGLLGDTSAKRMFLYRASPNAKFTFYIYHLNTLKYSVLTDIDDFAILKFVRTMDGYISLWQWINDAWVQIGVTQKYMLGYLSIYMATRGMDGARTIINDIQVRSKDYLTLNP